MKSRSVVERSVMRLDRGGPAVHLDQVADRELVLGEDEHAGDHVAHQRLRAEAERHAQDAGAREQRPDVPAQHSERVDERDHDDHGGDDVAGAS